MSLYSVKVSLKLRAGVAQRPIFARSQQAISHFPLPLVKAGHRNAVFCTPDFDGLAALLCSGDGLKPLRLR